MSLFKRLSATVVTRLDRVADRLENHDAVVQAALGEMQRKVAEAKVRFARVRRELEAVEDRIVAGRDKAARWRERAVGCGAEDEPRALECLARAREQEREIEQLETRRREYVEATVKLERAVEVLESRLAEIRQKQVLMRARQSTGQALSAASADCFGAAELDAVLERWEISVMEAEMLADLEPAADSLDREFTERETDEALRGELAALLAEENARERDDGH